MGLPYLMAILMLFISVACVFMWEEPSNQINVYAIRDVTLN